MYSSEYSDSKIEGIEKNLLVKKDLKVKDDDFKAEQVKPTPEVLNILKDMRGTFSIG